MENDERLAYVRNFITYDHEILHTLDIDAEQRDDIQPFIERELAKTLSLLVRLTGAKRVLELGSGVGYSTIWIAEAVCRTGGTLVTIDNHPRTSKEAHDHIEEAGLSDVVEYRFGDVERLLPEMAAKGECYDLIFQDCGKYVYTIVYEEVYRLLAHGGLLFTDDTLLQFDPSIRKGLGVYMDRYNKRLFADKRYYSTILPVGQGICLSLKEK